MMPSQVTIKDLLLAPKLSSEQVSSLLRRFGFQDIKKADRNLQSIASDPRERLLFAEILEESLIAFSESPVPDQALNNFERFSRTTFSKSHLFSYLQASPRTLYQAGRIFGGSPFLSDILIRNPEYFYWVFDPERLERPKTKINFRKELSDALLQMKMKKDRLEMLRIFKRKEMLRIGVRDLLRVTAVKETIRELSSLADILIESALAICEKEMQKRYGKPRSGNDGESCTGSGFTILALGKLGSHELNFSSDVDLIYLYTSRSGHTLGVETRDQIENSEYFESLSKEVTAAINESTGQGYVYRVDLRLRPEGEKGLIALSFEGYRRYYKKRGEIWERLALLRARTVAGDRGLGKAFLNMVSEFIYDRPFGREGLEAVRDCKKQIDAHVVSKNQYGRDVKRGKGGIREIEFIIQTLQLRFGKDDLSLRKTKTIEGLKLLTERKHLSSESESQLHAAYLFLRDLENKLQMVNDRQTHLIPEEPAEICALACRLGYSENAALSASDRFENDYRFHTERVHQVFQNLFYE